MILKSFMIMKSLVDNITESLSLLLLWLLIFWRLKGFVLDLVLVKFCRGFLFSAVPLFGSYSGDAFPLWTLEYGVSEFCLCRVLVRS